MTNEQRLKNLSVPTGNIDVVLDTDAYNEIDDQFAISYLLLCKEKLDAKALYAAPFLNERATNAADGMEKSYGEILKLLVILFVCAIMEIARHASKPSDRYFCYRGDSSWCY